MATEIKIWGDFNEYDLLIDPSNTRDHIEALVDKEFCTPNDLMCCIIETVTIGNLNGIGKVHLRLNNRTEEEMADIIGQYKSVIEKVRSQFKFTIAEHLDWYQRDESYYITIHHPNATSPKKPKLTWARNVKKAEKKVGDYVIEKQETLTDEAIKAYLDAYVQLLESYPWFTEHKYLTIIIKPVSVENEANKAFYPLGNLYLHFGTNEKKEKEVYQEFVNKLLLVWLKKYGATLVEELKVPDSNRTKPSLRYLPQFTEPRHLKKISGDEKLRGKITYQLMYEKAFDDIYYSDLVKKHLITPDHAVFKYLPELVRSKKGRTFEACSTEISGIVETIRQSGETFLKSTVYSYIGLTEANEADYLPRFLKVLSARIIGLVYNIVAHSKDLELNRILVEREEPTDNIKNVRTQIWNKYFIPLNKGSGGTYVYDSASPFEKEFISTVYKSILKTDSTLEPLLILEHSDLKHTISSLNILSKEDIQSSVQQ